jgi:hypothetical protein
VKALPTQGQYYDLAARINNPNQNHGSRKIAYQFKIYDINNREIGNKSGSTFILPRQEKYIIELRKPIQQNVARVQLNIEPVQWEKIIDYVEPEINVFEKKYQFLENGPPYSQASCVIKNASHQDYKNIETSVVVFSADNEVLGVNYSVIDYLSAGQDRFFSVPWHFELNKNAGRIDIEAGVNIFD